MTNRVPHKHAEVIKAWADGYEIQFKEESSSEWRDVVGQPSWLYYLEYRVKPTPVVNKFRVALLHDCGHTYPEVFTVEQDEERIENTSYFIRWLTDWIEYES